MKHFNLPYNWKHTHNFEWDTSMGKSLKKLNKAWQIREHPTND